MTVWIAVAVTAAGCYLLKYAGMSAPQRLRDHPFVRRFATAVPVALFAAMIVTQAAADEGHAQELVIDAARLGGLGAAVLALILRAPFLVVIVAAAGTAAGLRALGV